MAFESFLLTIGGDEAADLYDDLLSLEVELSDTLPATFRLQLPLRLMPGGTWMYLDEERFRVWTPVTISAGFVDSGREEIFRGYITHLQPNFTADLEEATLDVMGTDTSVVMDREEQLKAWPDKKDSDIAAEILNSYGFEAAVTDTEVIHEGRLSTVIQRETDWQFLRRLALRNGFTCYVEGEAGYFGPVLAEETPQPVLAAHFGDETTLDSFTVSVDALQPASVAMFQVDRLSKEVLSITAETGTQDALGEIKAADLTPDDIAPGRVYIAKNAATGGPEMTALCQGLYDEGAWFVTAEGDVETDAYAHVLRPRRLVNVKGVGETYSGAYHVTYVQHAFTPDGYRQSFKARRNGLMPTGEEAFEAEAGAQNGLL